MGKVILLKYMEIRTIHRNSELPSQVWHVCLLKAVVLGAAQLNAAIAAVSRHSLETPYQNDHYVTRHDQFFRQAWLLSSDNTALVLYSTRNDTGVFCKTIKTHKHCSFQTLWNMTGIMTWIMGDYDVVSSRIAISENSTELLWGPFHKPVVWSFQHVFLHFGGLLLFFFSFSVF